MENKACIFDLDGVIVDTARYHFLAWQQTAEKLGIVFTEHDNEKLKGVSRVRSLELILELGGVSKTHEEKEALCADKNDIFTAYISQMDKSEILPGVERFLLELRQAGIKIALGSASKNARTILTKIGLLDRFDVIVDGTHVTAAKPDPEVFLKGAQQLGIEPGSCCVFEDAQSGVEAARRAGMYCIGVGSPDSLGLADFCISNFDEMSIERLPLLSRI